jgi:hypothetical protein
MAGRSRSRTCRRPSAGTERRLGEPPILSAQNAALRSPPRRLRALATARVRHSFAVTPRPPCDSRMTLGLGEPWRRAAALGEPRARPKRSIRRPRHGRRARRGPARARGARRMALKPCLGCRRASPYQRSLWRQTSLMVTSRDGCCVRCGSRYHLSAHHIQARAEGGADTPENVLSLCVSCHSRLEAEGRRR